MSISRYSKRLVLSRYANHLTLPCVWRDARRLIQPWQIMDPKMDSGFVEPTDTFEPEWKVIDEDGISGEEVSLLSICLSIAT